MKNQAKQRYGSSASHKRRVQTVNVEKLSEGSSPSREMQYKREKQFSRVTDCETTAEYEGEASTSARSKFHSKSAKYVKTTTKYLRSTNECYSSTNKSSMLTKSKHAFEKRRLGNMKSSDSLSIDISGEDFHRGNSPRDNSTANDVTTNVEEHTYQERKVEISEQFELNAEYKKHELWNGRGVYSGESTSREAGTHSGGSLDFDRNSIGHISEDDLILQEDIDTEGRLGNENSLERNNTSRGNMPLMNSHEERSQCFRQDCRMGTEAQNQNVDEATLLAAENINQNTIKVKDCPVYVEDSSSPNSNTAEKAIDRIIGAKHDHTVQRTDSQSKTESTPKDAKIPSSETLDARVRYLYLENKRPSSSQSNDRRCYPSQSKSERELKLHNCDRESYHMIDSNDADRLSVNESERYLGSDRISLKSSTSSTTTYIITDRDINKENPPWLQKSLEEATPGSEKKSSLAIHEESLSVKPSSQRKLEKNANLPQTQESKGILDQDTETADVNEDNSKKDSRSKLTPDTGTKQRPKISAKSESFVSIPPAEQTRLIDICNSGTVESNITKRSEINVNSAGLPDENLHMDNSSSTVQLAGKATNRKLEKDEVIVGGFSSLPVQDGNLQISDTHIVSQSQSRQDACDDKKSGEKVDFSCVITETPKVASKSSLRIRYTTMNRRASTKPKRSLPPKQKSSLKAVHSITNSAEETNKLAKKIHNDRTTMPFEQTKPQNTKVVGVCTVENNSESDASTYYVHQATSVSNDNLPEDIRCIFHSREQCPLPFDQVRNMEHSQTQTTGSAGYKSTGNNSNNIASYSDTRNKSVQSVPETNTRQQTLEMKPRRTDSSKSGKTQPSTSGAVRSSLAGQQQARRETKRETKREASVLETSPCHGSYKAGLTPRSSSSRGKARLSPPPSPRVTPCYSQPSSLGPSAKTLRQRQEEATKTFLLRQKAAKKSGNLETKETSYKITFPLDVKSFDARQMKQAGLSFNQTILSDTVNSTMGGGVKICSPSTAVDEYSGQKVEDESCIETFSHNAGNSLVQNYLSLPATPRSKVSDASRPRSSSPPLRRSSPLFNKKDEKENTEDTEGICSRPNEKKSNAHTIDISQESENNNADIGFKDGFSQCCSYIQVKRSHPNVVMQAALGFQVENHKGKKKKKSKTPRELSSYCTQMKHVSDSNKSPKSTVNARMVSVAQISTAVRSGNDKDNPRRSKSENIESIDSSTESSEDSYDNCSSEENTNNQKESVEIGQQSSKLVDKKAPNESNVGKVGRDQTEKIHANFPPGKLEAIDHRLKPKPTEVKIKESRDQKFPSSSKSTSNEKTLETRDDVRNRFLCNERLDKLVEGIVKKTIIAQLEETLQSWGVDENKPSTLITQNCERALNHQHGTHSMTERALDQQLKSSPSKNTQKRKFKEQVNEEEEPSNSVCKTSSDVKPSKQAPLCMAEIYLEQQQKFIPSTQVQKGIRLYYVRRSKTELVSEQELECNPSQGSTLVFRTFKVKLTEAKALQVADQKNLRKFGSKGFDREDKNQKSSTSACNASSNNMPPKQVPVCMAEIYLEQQLESNPTFHASNRIRMYLQNKSPAQTALEQQLESSRSKKVSAYVNRTFIMLLPEAKVLDSNAQKSLRKLKDLHSRTAIKKPELIQLFPAIESTRVTEKKEEILSTIKTKQDLTHKELKYVERTPENDAKKRTSEHVAYLLSESKVHSESRSSKEKSTLHDISNDNFMDVVKKRFYALAPKTSQECCHESTHDTATSIFKKRYNAVDDECDLIPTKETCTASGSIKAPLCLFGWMKHNPERRHLETSIEIHRNIPETDTDKTRKNVKLSSERSRRKILAESKTSEDEEGKKLKTKRIETKKEGKTRRSSELESGAVPVLRNVGKISDARPAEGLRLAKTLWAVTQISVYNDGSRTYEVMKPEKERPPTVPDQKHKVFAVLP